MWRQKPKGLLHGVPNTSTTRGYKTEYSRVCYVRLRAHAATGGASTVDFRNSCSMGERGSLTPTLTLTLALTLTPTLTLTRTLTLTLALTLTLP